MNLTLFNKRYSKILMNTRHKKRFHKLHAMVLQLNPKKVLDIGESALSEIIKRSGFELEILNIKDCNLEKDKIPFKENSFDLVIYAEVIEHLRKNHFNSLREIKRILKPNGKIIFSTPNKNSLHRLLYQDLSTYHFRLFGMKECKKFFDDLKMDILYSRYEKYLDFAKKDFKHFIYYLFVTFIPFFRESLLFVAKKTADVDKPD